MTTTKHASQYAGYALRIIEVNSAHRVVVETAGPWRRFAALMPTEYFIDAFYAGSFSDATDGGRAIGQAAQAAMHRAMEAEARAWLAEHPNAPAARITAWDAIADSWWDGYYVLSTRKGVEWDVADPVKGGDGVTVRLSRLDPGGLVVAYVKPQTRYWLVSGKDPDKETAGPRRQYGVLKLED